MDINNKNSEGGIGLNSSFSSISKRTFTSAFIILFSLIIISGILTIVIPGGTYDNLGNFQYTNTKGLPFYKWILAPFEQLIYKDSILIIAISIFLFIVDCKTK